MNQPLIGVFQMATAPQPPTKKWDNLKVKFDLAQKVRDIAEARGEPIWQVMEMLLVTELPAAWGAVQAKLRQVRANKAKTAAIQAEARNAPE